MNSFAPLFSNIVDSSLWSEDDHVCKVFVTLLAIKNADHVARITAFALGRKCWPLDPENSERRALDALAILAAPDTKRIEKQPYDGRRIERTEDGWRVLNGQAYEDMMRSLSRKVYKARWERDKRASKKSDKPYSHRSKAEQEEMARRRAERERIALEQAASQPEPPTEPSPYTGADPFHS